ncbi:MAG TPA: hypothetical protein DHU96_13005 [Actinobacteria bacterium]|nr:hypothetical protein [Actinomycetota bacterium]
MLDRYQMTGDASDLDRAAAALETAYDALPESHPGRPLVLNYWARQRMSAARHTADPDAAPGGDA